MGLRFFLKIERNRPEKRGATRERLAPSLGGESVILMESKGADPWAELDLGMVGVRLERREKGGVEIANRPMGRVDEN